MRRSAHRRGRVSSGCLGVALAACFVGACGKTESEGAGVAASGAPVQPMPPVIDVQDVREAVPLADAPPVQREAEASAERQPWLDLIAQRPSAAVLVHGRLFIHLGRPHARAFLDLASAGGWQSGRVVDGETAGVITGRGIGLHVPLDAERAPGHARRSGIDPPLALALRVRAMVPNQAVTVLWNERPLAHLTLSEGWERRTFSLPADQILRGDNHLRLHFRKGSTTQDKTPVAALSTIEVGTRAQIVDEPLASDHVPYVLEGGGVQPLALRLSPGTGVAFYVAPPAEARLVVEVGGRGSFEILQSDDAIHERGDPPTRRIHEPLRETFTRYDLDLFAASGRPQRIELRVQSEHEDGRAILRAAYLTTNARRGEAVRPRGEPPDVHILAVEGLRPSMLRDRDAARGLPHLTAFMNGAAVFDGMRSSSAVAIPSHAALLSSHVPPVHLTSRGTFVAEAGVLLPEVFRRAGYETVMVTADGDVQRERGLLQGVDDAVDLSARDHEHDARAVVREVVGRVSKIAGARFSYAVMTDPNAPYDPPRDLLLSLRPVEGVLPPHLTHVWLGRVRLGKVVPSREQLDYVKQLYRGELVVLDQALGELLSQFERDPRRKIVALVGVHGEEFFEHGGMGHGRTLFEESVRVPFAIHAPGLLTPARVDAPCDLVDVAPTLVELAGLPAVLEWQGESLVPLVGDEAPSPRLAVAHLGDGSRAAWIGSYKLLLGAGRDAGSERIFDLRADPLENENLAASGGLVVRILRSALSWHLAEERSWRRARWGTAAQLRPAFADDHGM